MQAECNTSSGIEALVCTRLQKYALSTASSVNRFFVVSG